MKSALIAAVVAAVVAAASGTAALGVSWTTPSPAASHPVRDASTVPAPMPRTLLSTRTRIEAFAQDDDSIAWVAGRGPCCALHIQALASPGVVTIRSATCCSGLTLAGTQALWHKDIERSSNIWAEIDMYTASRGDPRVKQLPCCEWWHRNSPWVIPRAGSGGMLVYYSHRDQWSEGEGDKLTEYVIRRVTGGSTTKLFAINNPQLLDLDVDRRRIALVWNRKGEVRSPDGRIAASFRFRGTSFSEVALDGSTAAVLTGSSSGSKNTIALFDASSGRLRTRIRVSPGVGSVSAGGGWVVYQEGHSIRAFKARTSSVRLHLRMKREPFDLSVAGRRVAWAENHRGQGRIRAFTLPR